MQLQFPALVVLLAGYTHAHSWLECCDTDVQNYAAAKADPSLEVQQVCRGFARNKVDNGDWIKETNTYLWNLNGPDNTASLACRPNQASPVYPQNVPMTTAKPGQTLRLRYWGNGHSRWDIGSPNHRDPGLVRIYWAGGKERELKLKSDLTEANWIRGAQGNFSGDAIIEVNGNTMREKGNYYSFTLPSNMANGRHMMTWVWAWDDGVGSNGPNFNPATDYDHRYINSFSTCFDIMITDSSFVETDTPTSGQTPPTSNPQNTACTTSSCYRGGQTAYECKGSDCPPCWYASSGRFNCFEYGSNGKCPFGGAYDCKLNTQTRRALRFERSSVGT